MTRTPGKTPTPTQLLVLAYMREYFAQQDQLPPISTIAKHFGWASANGAQFHVDALERHGLVELNACGRYRFSRKEGSA